MIVSRIRIELILYDISIQRCLSGASCDIDSFITVVDSNTLAGDGSAFYMPYLLDPLVPSKLIAGSCRVWRGNGDPFPAGRFCDQECPRTSNGREQPNGDHQGLEPRKPVSAQRV